MSTETGSNTLDAGVRHAKNGISTYVRNLIDAHFEEYVLAFEMWDIPPETVKDILFQRISTLLVKLEKDMANSCGAVLSRGKIGQEIRSPEHVLGWVCTELVWGISGAKAQIRSSLLLEKGNKIRQSVFHALFWRSDSLHLSEEEIEREFEQRKHQYETILTKKGELILNGFLAASGKERIRVIVEREKQRFSSVIGPSKTYSGR